MITKRHINQLHDFLVNRVFVRMACRRKVLSLVKVNTWTRWGQTGMERFCKCCLLMMLFHVTLEPDLMCHKPESQSPSCLQTLLPISQFTGEPG